MQDSTTDAAAVSTFKFYFNSGATANANQKDGQTPLPHLPSNCNLF